MAKHIIKSLLRKGGIDIRRHRKEYDTYSKMYQKYKDYTMLPESFFNLNLELCSTFSNVDGDYVECGVWRGGVSGGIAEILGAQKRIHLFDSFEGLPPAKDIDGTEALAWQNDKTSPGYYNNCMAEESFAHQAMNLALHTNYRIYKGWFNETLASYEKRPISILRLDGDWYDSVMVCFKELFPYVVPGGIVIIDDYYTWDGCAKAVHDYLASISSPSRVYQWQNTIAYIIKKN